MRQFLINLVKGDVRVTCSECGELVINVELEYLRRGQQAVVDIDPEYACACRRNPDD